MRKQSSKLLPLSRKIKVTFSASQCTLFFSQRYDAAAAAAAAGAAIFFGRIP